MGYDNVASYWEDHCKDYAYGSTVVTEWKNGEPSAFPNIQVARTVDEKGGSKLDWQYRSFNFLWQMWTGSVSLENIKYIQH